MSKIHIISVSIVGLVCATVGFYFACGKEFAGIMFSALTLIGVAAYFDISSKQ